MAKSNADFLKLNAYSIKDLLIRKLSEDTNFTDQIYEGSNLNILIDLVAYLYQCLIYNLNNAAAESMFSDTQLYENINRLVAFLGYNPRGCKTASATFVTSIDEDKQNKCLLPYTYLDTGKSDSTGNRIYYSLIEPYYINSAGNYEVVFYNGKWKLYSTIFEASGTEYETFVLNDIKSDSESGKFVAWPYIDIYVKRYDNKTNTYSYIKFNAVDDGLLLNQNNKVDLYTSNSKVFGIRLNENKQYEIKFGNGYSGEMLQAGDQLYIFYLECNGEDGEIVLSEVANVSPQHSASGLGIAQTLYNDIFEEYNNSKMTALDMQYIKFKNVSNSTKYVKEETVEQIRNNAPFFNRTNNRLITCNDFEYYIKNNYSNTVLDVKCMNNWDYVASFYKWLYTLGINNHSETGGDYYLNENTLIKYDYKYSDSCDSNNIYLWVKLRNGIESNTDQYFKLLDNDLYKIKVLTSELTFLKPIDVVFDIFAGTKDEYRPIITNNQNNNSYIEITVSNNILYASDTIRQMVYDRIIAFFNESNLALGDNINFGTLQSSIFDIPGIEKIRTVRKDESNNIVCISEGITFASYSDTIMIDPGDDLEISNASRKLEQFQYPKFNRKDLIDYVTIIKKNLNTFNDVMY